MPEVILQPSRCIVGNCPDCGLLLVVVNDFESWPLVRCVCDWAGGTDEVVDPVRREFRPVVTS